MKKPALADLWSNFPDHATYPTLKDLFTWLGGQAAKNIDESGFGPNGNTCAARLSVAFNKSGAKIARGPGISTLGTADGSRIIFRVREFRTFLIQNLGAPTVDNTAPYDSAFAGKKGVIAFTVNFSDASGHIALWDGSNYREPSHDNYASYVNGDAHTSKGEFWELP
jgi:hypothetical protein